MSQNFLEQRLEFLIEKRALMEFFLSALTRLRQFLVPVGEHAFPKAAVSTARIPSREAGFRCD
jgi:hypothetical protein